MQRDAAVLESRSREAGGGDLRAGIQRNTKGVDIACRAEDGRLSHLLPVGQWAVGSHSKATQ